MEDNRVIVQRFYDDLWNSWQLDTISELIAPGIRFRGSLGTSIVGRDAFREYVEAVRAAFPDWHNQVDEVLEVDDRVVARLTWTGTHRGRLGPLDPTGRRVSYVGAAFFRVVDCMITQAWVVGDTQELWRCLGVLTL